MSKVRKPASEVRKDSNLSWVVAGPRVDLGADYGSAQTKREFFDSMPAEGREFFRELNAQLGPLEFVNAWKHKPGRGHDRK